MPEVKLKHYDHYRDLLEAFAQSLGITVTYDDSDGEGAYVPSRNKIKLDPDMSEAREIAVFLHELGHVLDDTTIDYSPTGELDAAYRAIYTKRYSKKQHAIVLRCEKRAWKYGRALAKKLKIRLGKWYDTVEKENLHTYKTFD